MKKLMRVTSIYCCGNQADADEVIKEDAAKGDLVKKTIEVKVKKQKGEIIDEKLKVTTVVDYDTDFFDEVPFVDDEG